MKHRLFLYSGLLLILLSMGGYGGDSLAASLERFGNPYDGVGSAARFSTPNGVATDSAGNVYVTDTNNDTIRKITSAGMVSTLAGKAGMSTTPFPRKAGVIIVDGTGAAARFDIPSGVATDSAGNVY